jgi:hypothetical protein
MATVSRFREPMTIATIVIAIDAIVSGSANLEIVLRASYKGRAARDTDTLRDFDINGT